MRAGSVFPSPSSTLLLLSPPSYASPISHSISLLQLLLRAELVGVAALLLAAVGGARVEASVAPKKFFFSSFEKKKKK